MNLRESAQLLKDILGLSYEPVAVKFLEDVVAMDGFELPGQRRYCQTLASRKE